MDVWSNFTTNKINELKKKKTRCSGAVLVNPGTLNLPIDSVNVFGGRHINADANFESLSSFLCIFKAFYYESAKFPLLR